MDKTERRPPGNEVALQVLLGGLLGVTQAIAGPLESGARRAISKSWPAFPIHPPGSDEMSVIEDNPLPQGPMDYRTGIVLAASYLRRTGHYHVDWENESLGNRPADRIPLGLWRCAQLNQEVDVAVSMGLAPGEAAEKHYALRIEALGDQAGHGLYRLHVDGCLHHGLQGHVSRTAQAVRAMYREPIYRSTKING